uniref:Uncharacterized protein n=1 Tax=Ditylenchus dipsaci TaxID=166011 RepID=A0A915DPY3_9BILA
MALFGQPHNGEFEETDTEYFYSRRASMDDLSDCGASHNEHELNEEASLEPVPRRPESSRELSRSSFVFNSSTPQNTSQDANSAYMICLPCVCMCISSKPTNLLRLFAFGQYIAEQWRISRIPASSICWPYLNANQLAISTHGDLSPPPFAALSTSLCHHHSKPSVAARQRVQASVLLASTTIAKAIYQPTHSDQRKHRGKQEVVAVVCASVYLSIYLSIAQSLALNTNQGIF